MSGLLVFGRTGQLAREIGRAAPRARLLGRTEADLADPAACAEAIRAARPAAVINAAAWTAVDAAETREAEARAVNAEAPGAMARACADLEVPFVQVSTDYVFGGPGPHAEDAPAAPLNAYGRTKLAGEAAVRAAGGPHAILRASWVVSAHGSNFAKTMLRLGAERDELRVVDDQIGAPTPAADLARAVLAMAARMGPDGPSGTFHLAARPHVSWAGLAAFVMREAGLGCRIAPIPSSEYPQEAPRPADSRLAGARLEAAFGIAPLDWRPGLRAILAELDARAPG